MTNAQLDHLRAIIAFLDNLLEQAKKRTPGRWEYDDDSDDLDSDGGWIYAPDRPLLSKGDAAHADMSFIASCAGNAEAGWIATRGEISDLIEFDTNCRGWKDDNGCAGAAIQYIQLRMAKILAAFPLESIKP